MNYIGFQVFAFTMSAIAVVFVGISFVLAASLDRMKRARKQHESVDALQVGERLERIERAVEAIALEVERIGEVERFGAKIIAALPRQTAASTAAAAPPEGRVITPH